MWLILQNPQSNSTHRHRIKLHFPNPITHFNPSKPLNSPFIHIPNPSQSFNNNLRLSSFHDHRLRLPLPLPLPLPIKAHHFHFPLSSINQHENTPPKSSSSTFDAFLSLMESLCVISSMLISVACVLNWVYFKQNSNGLALLGNRVLGWLLVAAVAFGSVIRRRQWIRVCGSKPRNGSGNLVERVEKLEKSMRSSIGIIRMLSRQLDKLGNRVRVTRKALKDPISKAAALAQKNSEVTHDLALQEDILEKELAEVQNVLLAMQDQQRKQLELILAVAKSGKLLESKRPAHQAASMNQTNPGKGLTQVGGQPLHGAAKKVDPSNNEKVGS